MHATFSLIILGSTAVISIILWIWVGMYYERISYDLCEDEINWKMGICVQTTGIVP